jgi:hypothetical protein
MLVMELSSGRLFMLAEIVCELPLSLTEDKTVWTLKEMPEVPGLIMPTMARVNKAAVQGPVYYSYKPRSQEHSQ